MDLFYMWSKFIENQLGYHALLPSTKINDQRKAHPILQRGMYSPPPFHKYKILLDVGRLEHNSRS